MAMSDCGTESTLKQSTQLTGVAFSGGGIRSAAFCSGVLRRLLQRDVELGYLSCVSGGGYTGTAYLDWKYHKEKEWELEKPAESKRIWQNDWHNEFFEQMHSRAGLLCNWQKPLQGILDTLVLCLLVLFVSFIVPFVGWGSFAFPLAFFIDLAFHDVLNAGRRNCSHVEAGEECDFLVGSMAYDRMLVFLVPLVCFIVFYIYSSKCKWGVGLARFMSVISGSLVVFTLLPWFIHDYIKGTPAYVEAGVVVVSFIIGFFFPRFRRYSVVAIIVYVFAYVVYWRVYEGEILGVEYKASLFLIFLFVSALVQFFTSIFGKCHLRLVHVYNRWRLQKAFYYNKSTGTCGCAGIGCHDIFPWIYDCGGDSDALNLEDLGKMNIKPQYISNIVVNGWRIDNEKGRTEYGLLAMSPRKIERIDCQTPIVLEVKREEETVAERIKADQPQLKLKDVKLSEAMATSAAAVSTHMGSYGDSYKSIFTILGLEMGSSMVYDMASVRKENCCLKVLPYLIRLVFAIPLFVLPIIYFSGEGKPMLVPIGAGTHYICIFTLSLLTVMYTGGSDGRYNNMARWLIIHIPFCQFIRSIFNVINTGPVPPAILHLSDGGHFENLAILPLLRERLEKIVVVNAGYTVPDSCYGDALAHALELAREHLNCSFSGIDGRDVLEDIKCRFVAKEQPRSYRFRVDYYDKDKREKVGEGEVILIAPRPPPLRQKTEDSKGKDNKNNRRKNVPAVPPKCTEDSNAERNSVIEMAPLRGPKNQCSGLEASLWRPGPDLEAEEVDHLAGCCCECCHECPCECCSSCCGVFPQHKTANQFFTPAMFSAYHREGYHACVEAKADVFLGAEPDQI